MGLTALRSFSFFKSSRPTLALMAFLILACSPPTRAQESDEPDDEGETEAVQAAQEPQARPLSSSELSELLIFEVPRLTDLEKQDVLAKYVRVDPTEKIPKVLREAALLYYDKNINLLPNKAYLSVIDYSAHSMNARFFIIDMATGSVLALHVAHGSGSDPERTGYAKVFGNTPGSNMSSLGYMRTAETYNGNHGLSLRLDGLSSTNSNIRDRAVVLHGANYVWEQNVKQGRSWGCPAITMNLRTKIINMLKGGSLIYAGRSQAGPMN